MCLRLSVTKATSVALFLSDIDFCAVICCVLACSSLSCGRSALQLSVPLSRFGCRHLGWLSFVCPCLLLRHDLRSFCAFFAVIAVTVRLLPALILSFLVVIYFRFHLCPLNSYVFFGCPVRPDHYLRFHSSVFISGFCRRSRICKLLDSCKRSACLLVD